MKNETMKNAMHSTIPVANEPSGFRHAAGPTRRGKAPPAGRAVVLVALLFLIGASAATSWWMKHKLPRETPPSTGNLPGSATEAVETRPDHSADVRRYNDAVAAALDRHLDRINRLHRQFEEGLLRSGPARFQPARSAIPGIRKRFASFSEASGVVKDGALDKVRGGDRLQRRFNAALDGPFVRPCARAGESLVADYETFAARLAAEDAAFREELSVAHGRLPQAVQAEFPSATLHATMAQTYGALRAMPLKAGLVAAETAIEVATIRSTAAAVRGLALRFGAKAIGKGAASAAAPAVDGPLPIGDVVAVGGALWTMYDIRRLTKVLPREIEKSLTSSVNALQSRTIQTVSDAAGKTCDAHKKAARDAAHAAEAFL